MAFPGKSPDLQNSEGGCTRNAAMYRHEKLKKPSHQRIAGSLKSLPANIHAPSWVIHWIGDISQLLLDIGFHNVSNISSSPASSWSTATAWISLGFLICLQFGKFHADKNPQMASNCDEILGNFNTAARPALRIFSPTYLNW
jgi:hypothetical protein